MVLNVYFAVCGIHLLYKFRAKSQSSWFRKVLSWSNTEKSGAFPESFWRSQRRFNCRCACVQWRKKMYGYLIITALQVLLLVGTCVLYLWLLLGYEFIYLLTYLHQVWLILGWVHTGIPPLYVKRHAGQLQLAIPLWVMSTGITENCEVKDKTDNVHCTVPLSSVELVCGWGLEKQILPILFFILPPRLKFMWPAFRMLWRIFVWVLCDLNLYR